MHPHGPWTYTDPLISGITPANSARQTACFVDLSECWVIQSAGLHMLLPLVSFPVCSIVVASSPTSVPQAPHLHTHWGLFTLICWQQFGSPNICDVHCYVLLFVCLLGLFFLPTGWLCRKFSFWNFLNWLPRGLIYLSKATSSTLNS